MDGAPPDTAAPPPRRLNLHAFARAGRGLQGDIGLDALPRLAASLHGDARELRSLRVQWELLGRVDLEPGGQAVERVRLRVAGMLPLLCQRCLQGVLQRVDDSATLRLVDEEPSLDAEELESEEESFCARQPVDVLELIEDQLILALPLVPMHALCPQPLPASTGKLPEQDEPSPFAVLARLRRPD